MRTTYVARSGGAVEPAPRVRRPSAARPAPSPQLPRFLRAPRPTDRTQRTAHGAAASAAIVVQRDEATSGSPPTTSSSSASLLDERLELDPELELLAARLVLARILDPERLGASILTLPYLERPPFLTAPTLPESPPLVPRGKGPDKARAGKAGDVLNGVLKIPTVKSALDRLKDDAADQAARDWRSLSLGGKSLVVGTGVLIGGSAIAGLSTDPDATRAVLGLLNGRVITVPYTKGTLGLELNTKGDNLMFGVHLDVGRFLPKSLGFGPGKAKALGAPPIRRSALSSDDDRIARSPGCACGGSCADCGGMRVSMPGEPEELEADRIAERVMRSPSTGAADVTTARVAVQREVASLDEEEEELHRRPAAGPTHTAPHSAVGAVGARIRRLQTDGGAPLPPFVRAQFEQRLGADLRDVRVHTGGEAADLATAVNARAFTVGRSIAFGSGQYSPSTTAGQRLLAHELVHVLQQASTSAPRARPTVRRRIAVHDPSGAPPNAPSGTTNEDIVSGYIATLCPSFRVSGGVVVPGSSGACPVARGTAMAAACGCMCGMHALRDSRGNRITWTIVVNDADWPHTDRTTKTVTVHSPFSHLRFGAWSPGDPGAGVPVHVASLPNWLVLGHELCGHAHLIAQGTHPSGPAPTHGGRLSHDPTVTIENRIAAEGGIPATERRGLFTDPHHGESVATVDVAGFRTGTADVATLPTDAQRRLDTAAAFILSGGVLIDLIGHADNNGGTAATNRRISLRRARAIQAELGSRRVSSANFREVVGRGGGECTAPGDQPACRRVEIRMFNQEGGSIGHP
jgi:outer membrane protein OmpA-like peptidoglycan-associated protein